MAHPPQVPGEAGIAPEQVKAEAYTRLTDFGDHLLLENVGHVLGITADSAQVLYRVQDWRNVNSNKGGKNKVLIAKTDVRRYIDTHAPVSRGWTVSSEPYSVDSHGSTLIQVVK